MIKLLVALFTLLVCVFPVFADTKPPHGMSINDNVPPVPVHAWPFTEASGRPADIGLNPLTTPTSGFTPTWSTQSGYGPVAVFAGGASDFLSYGTGATALAGSRKFCIETYFKPGVTTNNGAILQKKTAWNSNAVFSLGPYTDAGFGTRWYMEVADDNGVATNFVNYHSFPTLSTSQFIHILSCYNADAAAGSRMKFYHNGVLAGKGVNRDASVTVPTDTGAATWIGQGAPIAETARRFNGTIGHITIYPNFDPTNAEAAFIAANPFWWANSNPLLTNITATVTPGIGHNTATITWTTDVPATSIVGAGIASVGEMQIEDPALVTSHSVTLSGLQASKTYKYQVASVTSGGAGAESNTRTFTTLGNPATLSAPLVNRVSDDGFCITVTTSISTTAVLNYGLTAGLGSQKAGSGSATTHHLCPTGLAADTIYYIQAVVTNSTGNTTTGVLGNLRTKAADTTAPSTISDLSVAREGKTTGRIKWTAPGDDSSTGRPETYIIKRSTSAINAGNFDAATDVTYTALPKKAGSLEEFQVTGLTGGTTYHFAIKSVDKAGNVSAISNVPSFTTLSGRPTLDPYGGIDGLTAPSGTNVGVTHTGTVSTVSSTQVCDTTKSWTTNALVGAVVNPNIAYFEGTAVRIGLWYRITSNTATCVTVNSVDGAPNSHASAGNSYKITGQWAWEIVGDQWREITPEGNIMPVSRGVSGFMGEDNSTFFGRYPYEYVYLQKGVGAMTGNLADKAYETTANDVVHTDTGFALKDANDVIYIGSARPFNYPYLMGAGGTGGTLRWEYPTAQDVWASVNGTGTPYSAFSYSQGTSQSANLTGNALLANNEFGHLHKALRIIVHNPESRPYPANWATMTLAGGPATPMYWIRARVITPYSTGIKFTQIYESATPREDWGIKYTGASISIVMDQWNKLSAIGMNSLGIYVHYGMTQFNLANQFQHSAGTAGSITTYYNRFTTKFIYEGIPGAGDNGQLQPDMFEPALYTSIGTWLITNDPAGARREFRLSPNRKYVKTDEPDYMWGMSSWINRTDLAYAVMAGNPCRTQTMGGSAPSDKRMFAKFAARDFLRYKYRPAGDTITAYVHTMNSPVYPYANSQHDQEALNNLNAAWGTNYTTWGTSSPTGNLTTCASSGWTSGTNTGTGFMDENGKNLLVGSFPPTASQIFGQNTPTTTKAGVAADLALIRAEHGKRYVYTVYDQIRSKTGAKILGVFYDPHPDMAPYISGQADVKWVASQAYGTGFFNGTAAASAVNDVAFFKNRYDIHQRPVVIENYSWANQDSALHWGGTITAVSYDSGSNRTSVTFTGRAPALHYPGPTSVWFDQSYIANDPACNGGNWGGPTYTGMTVSFTGNSTHCVLVGQTIRGTNGLPGVETTIAQVGGQFPFGATREALAAWDIEIYKGALSARGTNGLKFVVGFNKWFHHDNPPWMTAENKAFGFMTARGNALDGVEATTACAKDGNNVWVGCEPVNMGNYFAPISAYNLDIEQNVIGETPVLTAPSFVSPSNLTVAKDSLDVLEIQSKGSVAPTLTVTSGSVPTGMSFWSRGDGSALVGGVPTVAGVYPFTVTASNGYGSNATQEYIITVTATGGGGDPPPPPPLPTVPFQGQFTIQGGPVQIR